MGTPRFHENGLTFAMSGAAGPEVKEQTRPIATGETSGPSAETPWHDRVVALVRVAVAANPGLSGAMVSHDGRTVFVTAPARTPELSRAGAAIVKALLEHLKPDKDHWIEGGFMPVPKDEATVLEDCVWIPQRSGR